jgi:hypothetical protein
MKCQLAVYLGTIFGGPSSFKLDHTITQFTMNHDLSLALFLLQRKIKILVVYRILYLLLRTLKMQKFNDEGTDACSNEAAIQGTN